MCVGILAVFVFVLILLVVMDVLGDALVRFVSVLVSV